MESVRASISPALADRYSIERELGSGAMALVFLAHDRKHDRKVAIKVLKPDIASAIGAERFHREIEVVAGLTHPHILPLHDSGEAAGLLYFVMPYVEGESVRETLQRDGRLPISEATRIAREMADALEFAHRHRVVHRDVKPANIMLTSGHALLADFGIARLVEGADATLTGTGITVGTPAYMSPEQVSGDEPLDGRSDIYSLGCVLFEMLAGRPPFEDASRRAVLVHHMVDSPPDIRLHCPDAPPEMVGIVRTALEKDPHKRFASAAEMSKALASVRKDIDVTGGARLRRTLKRKGRLLNRWQRVGLFALLVLVAIGAPGILREVFQPAEPAIAMDDPRGSYVVLPFSRPGASEAEKVIVADVADELSYMLNGWNRVDAAVPYELSGPKFDLGIEGRTFTRLEDGLGVARMVRKGTLIALYPRVTGDTVLIDARLYDVASGELLGASYQERAAIGDIVSLASPIAANILEAREDSPEVMKRESNNQEAWQLFSAARKALYDWRLQEAESGFRDAITVEPDFARAHHYLAVALFWQSTRDVELRRELMPEVERVASDAERLARTDELNPGLELRIEGLNSFLRGDYEAARTRLHQVLERDSTDAEAWMFLGVVESTDPWLVEGSDPPVPRGDINLARRAFRASSRLWPQDQISRGLQFEIARQLSANLLSPSCPVFRVPQGDRLVPPYADPDDVDWHPLFPLIASDTVAWVDCDPVFEDLSGDEARARFADVALGLYQQSVEQIERWALFAPDQPRPHEEWAEMALWWRSRLPCSADSALVRTLTLEALDHLELSMGLNPDATPQQRVSLAVLRMVVGSANSWQTARIVDEIVATMDAAGNGREPVPSWAAANAFLAAGHPSKAIERMRGIWVLESRSAADPKDEESRYGYGEVFQRMGEIRILGGAGATGPQLDAAFDHVDRAWTASSAPLRKRAVLRRSSATERHPSADIRPALAQDPASRALWLSEWGDLAPLMPPVWKGYLALNDSPDSSTFWLDSALVELDALQRPLAADYFVTALLAQSAEEHGTAEDLLHRVQTCPLDIDVLDISWGLSRLSRLYRARSLERLGRGPEALEEYSRFVEEWSEAEPELRPKVEEARQGVERLRGETDSGPVGGHPNGR